jgi:hypothetical protein
VNGAGQVRRVLLPPGVVAVALLVAACDPQADSSYLGEPLVTLRGRIASTSVSAPLEAAMLWQRGPPPSFGDMELATRAPVDAGFPASFTLRLYQPAPASALRALAPGEVTFGRANAAAIPFGIASAQAASAPPTGSMGYGVDASHWVVYLTAPVPADSLTAWWLGAALPRGFALLRVQTGCPAPEAIAACVEELRRRGVPEDGTGSPGTASGWCREPYRLSPAPEGEEIVLELGTTGSAIPADCP